MDPVDPIDWCMGERVNGKYTGTLELACIVLLGTYILCSGGLDWDREIPSQVIPFTPACFSPRQKPASNLVIARASCDRVRLLTRVTCQLNVKLTSCLKLIHTCLRRTLLDLDLLYCLHKLLGSGLMRISWDVLSDFNSPCPLAGFSKIFWYDTPMLLLLLL